jgi:uncharacterized protein YkwD
LYDWRVKRSRRTKGILGRRLAVGAAVLLATCAWARAGAADPADVIDSLRRQGCAQVAPVGAAVRRDSALDAAARELASDRELKAAIERVGYPVATSTSFHVRGTRADEAIQKIIGDRYCAAVNDPRFTELGFHQSGDNTWIVMASRAPEPFAALRDPAAVAQRVLDLVNAARAETRTCGRTQHAPAGPLALSTVLTAAASLHSLDMAERGKAGHEGSDGSDSGERIARAGYVWLGSGENVAAGQHSAEEVVAAWLDSPGHCATLMEPKFVATGVAFALAPGKNPDVYWTQVFAAPR